MSKHTHNLFIWKKPLSTSYLNNNNNTSSSRFRARTPKREPRVKEGKWSLMSAHLLGMPIPSNLGKGSNGVRFWQIRQRPILQRFRAPTATTATRIATCIRKGCPAPLGRSDYYYFFISIFSKVIQSKLPILSWAFLSPPPLYFH